MSHQVTLIPGDGVGPEITTAVKKIIDASGAKIDWEICEAGAEVFKKGLATGVPKETIDSISKNKVALKGPLETPIGFGEKSANVTLRKLFETYGNIRPIKEFPGVKTPYSGRNIDLVIVRESVEDVYAGIEHMQNSSTGQCLKLITRQGCERIVRLAFEHARAEGRKKVHCATKANIMKMTEGLLKRTFEEIATEYPEFETGHVVVDNCAHQLVKKPEQFDVLVMTNMNGDVLSDLSSALIGGLGFAPGVNYGDDVLIFEAVHGSAPKYAGKDVINPSAMLLSGMMMLRFLNEFKSADIIEEALFYTLQEGKVMPRDVVGDEKGCKTSAFANAIIENMGKKCDAWVGREYKSLNREVMKTLKAPVIQAEKLVGVDVFIEASGDIAHFGDTISAVAKTVGFELKVVACRGSQVYPSTGTIPQLVPHLQCRFLKTGDMVDADVITLLQALVPYHWMHVEKLRTFDEKKGFSKFQGEA